MWGPPNPAGPASPSPVGLTWDIMGLLMAGCCWAGGSPGACGGACGAVQGRRPRLGCEDGDWLQASGAPSTKPATETAMEGWDPGENRRV